jgi:hypothetical protein
MKKAEVKLASMVAGVVWSFINLLPLLTGLFFSQENRFDHDRCRDPVQRYEVLFPGFQLGCWLKQPLSKEAKCDRRHQDE